MYEWLLFDADGRIKFRDGGHLVPVQGYTADTWYDVVLEFDVVRLTYRLSIDGETVRASGRCAVHVRSVERLVLRTGPRRREPTLESETIFGDDLAAADDPVAPPDYNINYFEAKGA